MTYRCIHVFIGGHTQYHANITKEGGDNHTLDNDQLQDVPRLGTNGFADAKLMCTFLDGDEHDV